MVGQRIRDLRQQKGLTQEELAQKTEISVRTIQRIEAGDVDPRAYTLQVIAEALEIEFDELNNFPSGELATKEKQDRYWLIMLHASGLCIVFFPVVVPLIIWISKKDEVEGMKAHGADVLNFQISMLIYLATCGILAVLLITIPILIFLAIFSVIVITINTIKVMNDQPYRYPMSMKILKA